MYKLIQILNRYKKTDNEKDIYIYVISTYDFMWR